jgi:hypothetical protein
MSHNATTVNGTPPSASGALTLSNAYFGVTTYPVITSLSTIVANVPVGYSIPMGRNSSYNILTTKQGTSAQLGPTLNVISTTYQGDWFDRITLPAGTWLIRANIAQDPSNSSTGSFCLVNFSTGARLHTRRATIFAVHRLCDPDRIHSDRLPHSSGNSLQEQRGWIWAHRFLNLKSRIKELPCLRP